MGQCRCYVILLVAYWLAATSADFIRDENVCGPHNGRRLYLELGEHGTLRGDNIVLNRNSRNASNPYTGNNSYDQCSLELITCPSCIITLVFKSINLLQLCNEGSMTVDMPCRCDYVWISEPPFQDASGTPFCGHYAPITYRSNTRALSIVLLYSQPHSHAFTIEYTTERNRILLRGSTSANEISKSINFTNGGIMTSPFFPLLYPRDLGMEYIISCPNEVSTCRVRILFSDFQLAAVSIIEFYDWNGQRLYVSSGVHFRPPIIISTGPSLLIRFYANGGTGLGYKAFYSFIIGHNFETHALPITDCGGFVENLGGTITMIDMVAEGFKTYDCVWLIRSPKKFIHMKTHMYIKVITFDEMAGTSELIIKQGPTSAHLPLEVLQRPVSQLHLPKFKEHIAPVISGFHVSLRGSFGPNSRLAIAYAIFNYMDCLTESNFLCQNHRCISSQLNCDGFDHCGDNSDEPTTCFHEWNLDMQDRKWHQNKANYYFPKIDRYPDLKTATLIFVASSLGLILLISALIILIYRVGARARQQRELQSRLRTISELLDGGRIDEITISDDPPVYEAPPNYDEVIKLGIEEDETDSQMKKFTNNFNSRSIQYNHCSHDYESQISLNVQKDGSNENNSTLITSILSNSIPNTVPESPPPPYITSAIINAREFDYSFISNLPGTSESLNISSGSRGVNDLKSSGNGTSMTYFLEPENSHRDVSILRTWQYNNGSFFYSLPTSRSSSPSANALGAYTSIQASRSSNFPVSQRGKSTAAFGIMQVDCASVLRDDVEELGKEEGSERTTTISCDCEGACGCAFSKLYSHVISPHSRNKFIRPLIQEQTPRTDIGNRLYPVNRATKIMQLSPNDNYEDLRVEFDNASETTSIFKSDTLPNTLFYNADERAKFSVGSASCSSDFDLGGFYKSIRALDIFLAQRGNTFCNKREEKRGEKSMAVILFGTRHSMHSRSENALLSTGSRCRRIKSTRIHICQSIDDNFFN